MPGGATVSGTVRIVSPVIDANTRLGRVRVRLPLREDLRAGGMASAVFGSSGAPVTAVPEAAIRYDAEGASVVTIDDQNRAHQVKIRTGQRGGGWVQLIEGPQPGARVVLSAASFTLDGDRVKPIEQAVR